MPSKRLLCESVPIIFSQELKFLTVGIYIKSTFVLSVYQNYDSVFVFCVVRVLDPGGSLVAKYSIKLNVRGKRFVNFLSLKNTIK